MNKDSSQASGARTLLIVDDQHSVCVSLSYLLSGSAYRVTTAESGQSAIGLAETGSFDGALIDVHMPGMNGFDTCIALQSKAAAVGRVLRVWFMTGAFTSVLERRCAELGALGVFRKPFDFPSFLAQLESGFDRPIPIPTPTPALSCIAIDDTTDRRP